MGKFDGTISAVVALLSAATLPAAASARDVVIHAGTLLDGTMDKPEHNVSIVIKDDRIVAIVKAFITPQGADVIDLSKQTVLPGLIEGHDHLGGAQDTDDNEGHLRTEDDNVVNVIRNAYSEISQGFTSTRDCGTLGVDFKAIKYAIAKERLIGPRIWASLEYLGPEGGHSDPWNNPGSGVTSPEGRERAIIRGPIDAREKVREHFRRGANLIKIMPSGGVSSLDDNPNQQTMTLEEVKAVVDAAHALGMRVAAHASGLGGIRVAIEGGVDSIEHGTYADVAALKQIKARGIFLDTTLTVGMLKYETALANPGFYDPRILKKGLDAWPRGGKVVRAAHDLGIKIAMGTDQSSLGRGLNKATGIWRLSQNGLSPQEAIVAATGTNAEMIGSDDIGLLKPGRYADIIAVEGDPIADIKVLQHVSFVMKGGEVFKQNDRMAKQLP